MLRLYCHLVIWWGWWNWKCQTLLVLYCVRLHTSESLRSLTEYEYESMTVSVSQCLSHTVNVSVPVYVVTTSCSTCLFVFLSRFCLPLAASVLFVSLSSLSLVLSHPPPSLSQILSSHVLSSLLSPCDRSVCLSLSLSTSPWIPPWVFLSQSHPTNCLHMCMVPQHMYTCMHTCMHTCTHTQWCTQWDAHTHTYTHKCTHTNTHTHCDSLCLFPPSVVISVTVSLTSWSWMKFLQILYIMKQQIVLISNVIIVFSNTQQLA